MNLFLLFINLYIIILSFSSYTTASLAASILPKNVAGLFFIHKSVTGFFLEIIEERLLSLAQP
jgi:hypothetical protein